MAASNLPQPIYMSEKRRNAMDSLPGLTMGRQMAADGHDLRWIANGSRASQQTKMVPAKSAAVGMEQPSKGSLKTVPSPNTSEVDGFAVRTACGKQPEGGVPHRCWPRRRAAFFAILTWPL